jgi:hypothetical protein
VLLAACFLQLLCFLLLVVVVLWRNTQHQHPTRMLNTAVAVATWHHGSMATLKVEVEHEQKQKQERKGV